MALVSVNHSLVRVLMMLLVGFALDETITAIPMTQPKLCAKNAGCMLGKYMPGYQSESFEAFLGIPYAKPPTGALRLKNPEPHSRWFHILNATTVKSDCIQKNYLIPNPIITGSEDCLYLNVYRPMKALRKNLPVMVYIYGGGWFSGSSNPEIHGPEYFMDTQDVIFVTFNYRLGAFGFLSTHDTNMPGNFGLKDQLLALRWVQENIESFGGNPKRVTLFGQSAGAVSAHMHVLSPRSNGLFQNVITLSGAANAPWTITQNPLEQARLTAELSNISNAQNMSTDALSLALRQVDAETLVNAGDGLKFWHVDHLTNFRPIAENDHDPNAFLTAHPEELLAKGKYQAVPWMMVSVPGEGAVRVAQIYENIQLRNSFNSNFDELLLLINEWPNSFSKQELQDKTLAIVDEYFGGQHEINNETVQGFLDMFSDRGFNHPAYHAIKDYVNTINTDKYPLYLYKFNYQGPQTYANIYTNGQITRDYGVVHCDELLYLFRTPLIFADFDKNSLDALVIKEFVGNLVHFAKYSKPSNSKIACTKEIFNDQGFCNYQEYVNQLNSFQIISSNIYNKERIELWDNLLNDNNST